MILIKIFLTSLIFSFVLGMINVAIRENLESSFADFLLYGFGLSLLTAVITIFIIIWR